MSNSDIRYQYQLLALEKKRRSAYVIGDTDTVIRLAKQIKEIEKDIQDEQ